MMIVLKLPQDPLRKDLLMFSTVTTLIPEKTLHWILSTLGVDEFYDPLWKNIKGKLTVIGATGGNTIESTTPSSSSEQTGSEQTGSEETAANRQERTDRNRTDRNEF